MEGWSMLFTVAAIAGVLLMFVGAWLVVRIMRARRPGSTAHDLHEQSHARAPDPDRPHPRGPE